MPNSQQSKVVLLCTLTKLDIHVALSPLFRMRKYVALYNLLTHIVSLPHSSLSVIIIQSLSEVEGITLSIVQQLLTACIKLSIHVHACIHNLIICAWVIMETFARLWLYTCDV